MPCEGQTLPDLGHRDGWVQTSVWPQVPCTLQCCLSWGRSVSRKSRHRCKQTARKREKWEQMQDISLLKIKCHGRRLALYKWRRESHWHWKIAVKESEGSRTEPICNLEQAGLEGIRKRPCPFRESEKLTDKSQGKLNVKYLWTHSPQVTSLVFTFTLLLPTFDESLGRMADKSFYIPTHLPGRRALECWHGSLRSRQ